MFSRSFDNRVPRPGDLIIEKTSANCVDVFYVPQEVWTLQVEERHHATKYRVKLMEINRLDGSLTVFPTYAPASKYGQLDPMYDSIERIKIEGHPPVGFDRDLPETEDDIINYIEEMPSSFKKDYRYGLGPKFKYRFLPLAVEELSDCNEIIITKSSPTRIDSDNKTFYIAQEDFDEVKKGLDRITDHTQSAALTVKEVTTYNILAKKVGREQKPTKLGRHPLRKLFTIVAQGENAALQDKDQEALLKAFEQNTRAIADGKPEKLAKLQGDIELVTLERFIERYEGMAKRNASESSWQILFNENPFILGLVFGYPIIKVQDQASVGGRKLSGSGDKIADFLVKNSLTDNAAIIEIKKPQTKLIRKNRYREGVYPPTNDLSASIAQTLDQKYQFQSQIAQIKHNSNIDDIESYSVNCCLVIGTTPSEKDQRKSFELFRRNSKDVEVVTFDELLEKLRQLREFLADTGKTLMESQSHSPSH